MPTGAIVLLIIMLIGVVILVTFVVRSDRKAKQRRTGRASVGGASSTTSVSVDLECPPDAALGIAEQAMRSVGGSHVALSGDGVVSWTAVPFLGLGWAPQQLAVGLSVLPDGRVRFLCTSQPRFGTALWDAGRSKVMADRLAQQVVHSIGG